MQNKIQKYPKDLGFYMPAEWQRHDRCWMHWPTGIDPRRYPNLDKMRQGYANTARAIVEFEPVTMIANKSDVEECQKLCGEKVENMEIPTVFQLRGSIGLSTIMEKILISLIKTML